LSKVICWESWFANSAWLQLEACLEGLAHLHSDLACDCRDSSLEGYLDSHPLETCLGSCLASQPLETCSAEPAERRLTWAFSDYLARRVLVTASGETVTRRVDFRWELTDFSEAAEEIDRMEPLLMVPAKPQELQVLAVIPGELQVRVVVTQSLQVAEKGLGLEVAWQGRLVGPQLAEQDQRPVALASPNPLELLGLLLETYYLEVAERVLSNPLELLGLVVAVP
jgi:hypothetical protein